MAGSSHRKRGISEGDSGYGVIDMGMILSVSDAGSVLAALEPLLEGGKSKLSMEVS